MIAPRLFDDPGERYVYSYLCPPSLFVCVCSVTALQTKNYALGDTITMMLMARQKVLMLAVFVLACLCLVFAYHIH